MTTELLTRENIILNDKIKELEESLRLSQSNFEHLKSQNDQLITSNNALTEQLAKLTAEFTDLKNRIQPNVLSIDTNVQQDTASSPSPAKGLKRQSLRDADETAKKVKNFSWAEASAGSSSQMNTEIAPPNDESMEYQHNLTNNNDNANRNEKTITQHSNTGNSFRTVSYKKPKNNKVNSTPKTNADTMKHTKPAPIQVNIGKNGYLALHEALNRKLGSGKFVANNMIANQAVRIQPIDNEIGSSIAEFLISHGYEFHSFKSKTERGKCYILRGLNEVQNTEHIHAALIQGGFPAETTVTQHITGFQKAHPEMKHNVLFRIVTPNSFDEKVISEIDALFDLKVKFEKMKGSKVIQCKRCQEYFHSASSCHHPFRCVKCKENHEIGKCPRDSNPDLPIRCVNCDGAHSANNHRECKYFNEKIAPILNKKRGQNTPNQLQRPKKNLPKAHSASNTNSITSYAKAVRSTASMKSINQPKTNVSVKPSLTTDEKFEKLLEAQLQMQNQIAQMFGNLNRAMAPRGPQWYPIK